MFKTSNLSFRVIISLIVLCLLTAGVTLAQRPKSPRTSASTQIGDAWIDVSYSSPILRGRTGIFGSGAEYGTKIYAGADVWRAGADVTTRITTEADLMIGDSKVPAGEYSFFIELKEGGWTGIISKQPHMDAFDRAKMAEGITWGAYGYDPKHDVARAPMAVTPAPQIIDNLIIGFGGVTAEGGNLFVVWDNQVGALPFTVAK
ncbi:MAG: DUF2911 domain-containing protein [Acidobacteriota bacterium]|nr:DUF2911 domain-containing protein [Acidobacteriota bacterium]